MTEYESLMSGALRGLKEEGFTHGFFGDIFLEDLRLYREQQLTNFQMKAEFPLWKLDTLSLIHEFIDLGFKGIVVCVNAEVLDKSFAGRIIDHDFINDLPHGIDPSGENGEFHSFVFDGPYFKKPVLYEMGETVYREYKSPKDKNDQCFASHPRKDVMGFWFCELLPQK